MVEARGVEPLSETPSSKVSTRLACGLVFSERLGPLAALPLLGTCLISTQGPVTRLRAQPSKYSPSPSEGVGVQT